MKALIPQALLGPALSTSGLLAELDQHFGVRDEGTGCGRRVYLDTPERMLVARGERLWMCRQGEVLHLCHRRRGGRSATEACAATLPQRIADLPASMRRGVLRRADPDTSLQVLAVVDWQLHFAKLESVGGEAPLVIEQRSTRHHRRLQRLPSVIVMQPGAQAEVVRKIEDVASEHGFRAFEEDELEAILRTTAGPLKRRSALKRPAGAALQAALREERATLRRCLPLAGARSAEAREEGATIALHQLRIALRRTRALLANFRHLLPPRSGARFVRDFAWFHAASSAMRDLDVLHQHVKLAGAQAAEPRLHAMMEARAYPALQSALEAARGQAEEAWHEVAQSRRTQRFFDVWDALLSSAPEELSPRASEALGPIVRDRLMHRAKQLRRAMPKHEEDASGEEFHTLRIAAKKLRYVLESFRSLCRRKPADRLLKALRRVQESLGERNDDLVHRDLLAHMELTSEAREEAEDYLRRRSSHSDGEPSMRKDLRKLSRVLKGQNVRRIIAT